MDNSLQNIPAEEGDSAGSSELCAPLASLQVGGVPPAEGDTVSVTVEGTISRIDNDHAYITPETVNGEDVSKAKDDMSDDDMMDKRASQLDAESGYG